MDDTSIEIVSSPGVFWWQYGAYFVLALIILGCLFWGIWKLKRLLTRPEMQGLTREQLAERWRQIRSMSQQQGLMGAKLALLEADTLLDSGLKSLMIPGTTLGERLKVACYKYPKLREVWWAHKLRNQLAHDATSNVSLRQIQEALNEFERALKILNVF